MSSSAFITEGDSLAAFRPQACPAAWDRGTRLAMLALVILLHAAILALLLWTRHVAIAPLPMEAMIEIDMHQPSPPKTNLTMKFSPLAAPRITLPAVAAPEFTIAPPDPSPVAVAEKTSPAPSASAGSGAAQTGGDDYLIRLHDRFFKFMRCPILSTRLDQNGTAIVHFILDADSHVAEVDIFKSSGLVAIDQEALAVVRRAEPLPPVPPTRGPGLNAIMSFRCELPRNGL